MTDVQVLLMFLFLDSKMAKQQLQKWELKFVTELEPLEGASPGGGPSWWAWFWQLARLLKTELLLLVIIRHLHLRPSRSSVS